MQTQRNITNILVTGGAGFIGSAFIRYLLSPEAAFKGTCVNLDALTYAGNLENLASVDQDPRYIFEKGDIRNEALVEHLCQEHAIDAIIHFAAESHVDRSILGPQAFIETNILGTFHLLEVVKRNPHIHFHHVSTDEVYGSLGASGYFTEESPYQPNSPYSASKASSDHLVRAYHHTYQLSTCLSNCSNNYGPYHFPEKLIPVMILNCLDRKPLPVYGNGLNVRDWLYVEDHAKALYLLLQYGRKGETYNIGGEAEWRNIDLVHEMIRIIADIQSMPAQELEKLITFVKDRPGHDLRYAIDCSKIKKEIGWGPSHKFPEGLKRTILWYMNNMDWVRRVQTGAYRQWMEVNYVQR
ncbi:dTDP-glucose 4,6-dehydratase [Candidatus Protochlamydia phocaeensis]|uniref:dTDP-glucose 4,6-dehydratase n=1 Tax=Candidatus Protochlamydia phocaeensis TaxID=1414722 RepID=UPI0008385D54|nr:dTDP-glucose 4,6-dehydratase [Candidatus Protochlamydia phocaeensis]